MEILKFLLLCIAASLPAAWSTNHPKWKLYSHSHHRGNELYEQMPGEFQSTWLQRHSDSELMVQETESALSSMDAHDERDLHALLSFKESITRDPFSLLSNWRADNSDNMCSSWYGVRCRKHTKRVVGIDLSGSWQGTQWLEGTLSPSLGNLSLLCSFNISGQWLTGRIPPQFGQLKSLQILDLGSNDFSGSIPAELGQLQNLRTLNICSTLIGGIPPQIGRLKSLRVLDLSESWIEGSIPVELGLLKELRVLDLSENYIGGSIPVELGLLKELRVLHLSGNELNGSIPVELGLLQKLESLFLEKNDFSGNIPCELGPISSLIMVPLPSRGIFSDNQVSFHNKGRSFLLPSPLKKYREPRVGDPGYDISNGPSVILPSQEIDSVNGGCFNTLLAMKRQVNELQHQGSSTSIQMELERLRSEYSRSLHMIQQWQQVYQDLHYFCVTELMGDNKAGEDGEEADRNNEKGKRGRGKATGRK